MLCLGTGYRHLGHELKEFICEECLMCVSILNVSFVGMERDLVLIQRSLKKLYCHYNGAFIILNLSSQIRLKPIPTVNRLLTKFLSVLTSYWEYLVNRSRGSSVSIVSDYGLDERAMEVRSPADARGLYLYLLCPARLWGPPSLLYNGYRPRRDVDHSPSYSTDVVNE
jgi:hypothetical protein